MIIERYNDKKAAHFLPQCEEKILQKNRKISQNPLTNKVGGGIHFYLHTSTCQVWETNG